jgi:hypothetical protein
MSYPRHVLWLVLSCNHAFAVNLQEGQWRIAVQIEIPNAAGPDAGPARQEVCLRPQDVSRFVVPPNSPCKVSEMVSTDKEMRWKLACQYGSMRSSGSGLLEFSGDRFKGVIESQSGPPYNMHINQKIEGRRMGPCKFPPQNPNTPGGLKPYGEK